MPIVHSSSPQALKRNMATLYREIGKSPHIQSKAQAQAIALETQRRAARAMGGVVPGYDLGGAIHPQQQQPPPPSAGVMPSPPWAMSPQMPGNAPPVGVAGQMGPPPPPGMNNAPPVAVAPPLGQPQGQWASGVAQNAAPPAIPQNAPPMPPNAAPQQQPMGKQLMASGGALQRSGGGFSMAKAPHLDTSWQTRADARQMRIGPILSAVPGRTDNHKSVVPSGSYILPSQHVASLGQGNTLAGMSMLNKMFGGPWGTSAPKMAHGPGAPKPQRMRGLADGGAPDHDTESGGEFAPVPVDLSGGEYSVPPWAIIQRFGDLDTGHKALDGWVLATRKKEIQTQRKLPPPAKS